MPLQTDVDPSPV